MRIISYAVEIKIETLGTIVVTLKDLEASTEDYGKYTILMIDCE